MNKILFSSLSKKIVMALAGLFKIDSATANDSLRRNALKAFGADALGGRREVFHHTSLSDGSKPCSIRSSSTLA